MGRSPLVDQRLCKTTVALRLTCLLLQLILQTYLSALHAVWSLISREIIVILRVLLNGSTYLSSLCEFYARKDHLSYVYVPLKPSVWNNHPQSQCYSLGQTRCILSWALTHGSISCHFAFAIRWIYVRCHRMGTLISLRTVYEVSERSVNYYPCNLVVYYIYSSR